MESILERPVSLEEWNHRTFLAHQKKTERTEEVTGGGHCFVNAQNGETIPPYGSSLQLTAVSIRHDQDDAAGWRRARLAVADEFYPAHGGCRDGVFPARG